MLVIINPWLLQLLIHSNYTATSHQFLSSCSFSNGAPSQGHQTSRDGRAAQRGDQNLRESRIYLGLSENRLNPYTQWFCWSLSLLNGYFIGNIPYFQTIYIHLYTYIYTRSRDWFIATGWSPQSSDSVQLVYFCGWILWFVVDIMN